MQIPTCLHAGVAATGIALVGIPAMAAAPLAPVAQSQSPPTVAQDVRLAAATECELLAWLNRVYGYAPRVELLRVALVLAPGEHIDLVRHHDVGEAGLLEEDAPLCIQQSAGNSAAP